MGGRRKYMIIASEPLVETVLEAELPEAEVG
jgi:hypothetical protein